MRASDRGPEGRLRSDSVTGPLPRSPHPAIVFGLLLAQDETGRFSATGPVTQSLLSRTSGPGPRIVRSHPLAILPDDAQTVEVISAPKVGGPHAPGFRLKHAVRHAGEGQQETLHVGTRQRQAAQRTHGHDIRGRRLA